MLSDREILALYDREVRIENPFPGVRWELRGNIVRYVDLIGDKGMVIYSRLDARSADEAIEEQIAYFESVGQNFEWKVYGHDKPPNLRDRLSERGFETGEPEALLIYDLAEPSPALLAPVTRDVRQITDPARVSDVEAVLNAVWREDMSGLARRLAGQLEAYPDTLSIYVIYEGKKPVSAAWVSFEGGQFAGLWGGSTLKAYRNKGNYKALLAVRAQAAIRRGARFLTIDASPMSRPIVERYGFRFMTMMYPRLWQVGKAGG